MAFTYPDDEPVITKGEAPRALSSYRELVLTYEKARRGDPVARVELASLPQREQRLARLIVDSFADTPAMIAKGAASVGTSHASRIASAPSVYDPDPIVREAAWALRLREAAR